jgi:hypothetical protein
VFADRDVHGLFVVYGFDTAGTFGEETLDASRQAPRGISRRSGCPGIVGAIFLLAVILATPDMPAASRIRSRSPTAIKAGSRRTRSATVYLFVILLASSSARRRSRARRPRLMFSMGRDRHAARRGLGHGQHTFKTPANAASPSASSRRIPFLVIGSPAALAPSRDRPDLPQLPAVQHRRARRPASAAGRAAGLVQARRLGP